MATEKILNTRIQLKYDTLANWNASSFKLKAGELAIVNTGSMVDGSTHSNAQYPVLFKVGTGDHTFAELPFASALAADVYAWAKASDVILEGKTIKFVGTNKSITLNYITSDEAQTLINNALASYSTTEQMNAAIKVETDRATGVEAGLNTRIETLEAAVGEDGSVADKVAAAVSEAKDYADGIVADAITTAATDATSKANAAKDAAISAAATDATSKANAAKDAAISAAAIDATQKADDALTSAKTYAEGQAANALSEAKADATAKANAAESAAKSHAETKASAAESAAKSYADELVEDLANGAVATNASNISTLSGTVATNKEAADATQKALDDYKTANNKALADEIARAEAAEAQALADAKAYADDLKKSILGEGISETFDTLVEIQTWINGDGVNATELSSAIAAEAKLRSDEDTRLAGLISAEASDRADAIEGVQDQIDALGITDGKVESAATADVANSLSDSAKAEVKEVKVDNAFNADKLGNVAASNYALKTDAQGYADGALAEAKTYAEGQASAAQAAAISAAASDATAKANAAEAAAKSAAATDATNKANQALADAKAYVGERETAITSAYQAYADQAELDAIASAKAYTDGREVEIKKYADQAEADALTAAKEYANGLAGNYATAAQGAKADTALQKVNVGSGLKVSEKANNEQTIEIDTDVVFVFDCGNASDHIN